MCILVCLKLTNLSSGEKSGSLSAVCTYSNKVKKVWQRQTHYLIIPKVYFYSRNVFVKNRADSKQHFEKIS